MKQVFSLKQKLLRNPNYNAYLRNPAYAHQNNHGLYNTSEWWENIENGKTHLGKLTGIIYGERYLDKGDTEPVREIKYSDGSISWTSYHVNSDEDLKYYVIGKKIEFVYVSEKLISPIKTVKTKAPISQTTIIDIKIILEVFIEE